MNMYKYNLLEYTSLFFMLNIYVVIVTLHFVVTL